MENTSLSLVDSRQYSNPYYNCCGIIANFINAKTPYRRLLGECITNFAENVTQFTSCQNGPVCNISKIKRFRQRRLFESLAPVVSEGLPISRDWCRNRMDSVGSRGGAYTAIHPSLSKWDTYVGTFVRHGGVEITDLWLLCTMRGFWHPQTLSTGHQVSRSCSFCGG